jgi:hypothetical protein
MSLGRLLTSGKCLVGLQKEEIRYEMRTKNLLPKFGSNKNPFTATKPQPLQADLGPKLQTEARTLTPAEATAAKLKETKPLPSLGEAGPPKMDVGRGHEPERRHQSAAAAPCQDHLLPAEAGVPSKVHGEIKPARSAVSEPVAQTKVLSGAGRWARKLNPLSWFEGRKSNKIRKPASVFEKEPVQGELSLDRIKVVRNDLSEADLEIVPVKISLQPKAEPVVRPVVKAAETDELIKT